MQMHDEPVFEMPLVKFKLVRKEIPGLMSNVAKLDVPLVAEPGGRVELGGGALMETKAEKLAVLVEAIQHSADSIKVFCKLYPDNLDAEQIKKILPADVSSEKLVALRSALSHLVDIAIHCEVILFNPLYSDEESLVNFFPQESRSCYERQVRAFVMPMHHLAIRIVDSQCRLHHSKICEFPSLLNADVEISKSQLQDFLVDRIAFKALLLERNRLAICVRRLHEFGFVGSKLQEAPKMKPEALAFIKQKIPSLRLSKSDEAEMVREAENWTAAAVSSYKFDNGEIDLLLSMKIATVLHTPESESAKELDAVRGWLQKATNDYSEVSFDGVAVITELEEASVRTGSKQLSDLSDATNDFLNGENAARQFLGDDATWKYLKLTSRTTLGDYVERFNMFVRPLNISNPNLIDAEDRETYIELCHVVTGGHWRAAYALSRAFLERLIKKHQSWDSKVDSSGHGMPLKTQLKQLRSSKDKVIAAMVPDLERIVDDGNVAMHNNLGNLRGKNISAESHPWRLQKIVISLLRLAQHIGTKEVD